MDDMHVHSYTMSIGTQLVGTSTAPERGFEIGLFGSWLRLIPVFSLIVFMSCTTIYCFLSLLLAFHSIN